MKILFLLNSDRYSGAENVVITIIHELKKSDSNYDVLYVSRDGAIRERLLKEDIEFRAISKMTISEIRRVITEYKPDIIHANDFTAAIVSSMTTRKIPIIAHLHNNSPWIKKYNLKSLVFLLSSINYRKILLVSSSIKDEYVFAKYMRDKFVIIGNPISNREVREKAGEGNEKKYDIAFLGRLSLAKNPMRFIWIVDALKKKRGMISAIMIGDGELREICENKIAELNLQNNVQLVGFCENPYPSLSASRIMCMPSDWEGFGLAATEALALGIPVVASNVGGLPGIVNESCGRICEEETEFCEELECLLENKEYYAQKVQGALQRADEIENLNMYMANLRKIYDHMLK